MLFRSGALGANASRLPIGSLPLNPMGEDDLVVLVEKRRLLKSKSYLMTVVQNNLDFKGNVVGTTTVDTPYPLYSWQVTRSEGHRWPPKKERYPEDIGGPFETVKSTFNTSYHNDTFSGTVNHTLRRDEYSGQVVLAPLGSDIHALFKIAEPTFEEMAVAACPNALRRTDLLAKGSILVGRAIPTNPVVDGSVGLAELFREGIPSMIGSTLLRNKVGFLRGLGSEYLNYEFGWKPLVSDVKNAAKAIVESERIINQLVRDSGKMVHRRRHFLPIHEVSVSVSNTAGYPYNTNIANWWNTPWWRTTDIYTRDTWFSGVFTFEYDPGSLSEISRIATQARLLYGLQLTPEVLWNLAPWSWLVDWFANVGPLLHNVSAFQNDQLVMRYGYVMDRHRRSYNLVSDVTGKNGNKLPRLYHDVYQLDWKRRAEATPYGFGVASESFTIRQWAILSALGITRRSVAP